MDPTLIISGIRALIRLAAPLATQDALTRKLMVIQGQVGSSGKLPSANSSRCSSSLTGWRRNSTRSPGSAAACSPSEGAPAPTFNAMTQRKKEMTDRLEADGVATDCRTIPATQSFDAT